MPRAAKLRGLGPRIAEIRADVGLSQEEFGRRIGLRQSVISKYEKGYPTPKIVRIAISAIYGVSLSWLEKGEPPKFAKPAQTSVTDDDLELLRFLKRQDSLYDVIRSHLSVVRRKAGGSR